MLLQRNKRYSSATNTRRPGSSQAAPIESPKTTHRNVDMSHFLLLTYPLPGHINPTLHFAERLSSTGVRVTFFTTVYANKRMIKSAPSGSLSYATFSDGYDNGPSKTDDKVQVGGQFKKRGQEALAQLLGTLADEGRPVTCLIYTLLLPWAADVARSHHIPHVLLWIQPAAVFSAYYHYFHDYHDLIVGSLEKDPSCPIKLPGLPPLAPEDLPSFILPSDESNPYSTVISYFKEQFEEIDREEKTRLLVNTFEEAEPETIKTVDRVEMVCVGPLIPPAFFDRQEVSNATDGGELYKNSKNCIKWLDSKAEGSVVYMSFGSIIEPSENQLVEIFNGLLESGHPFLWVLRPGDGEAGKDSKTEFWEKAKAAEERGEGMVVPWCPQLAVLSHSSVGCFVSHCGWNSTTESLAAGVPMVCLPTWSDQTTNAKLVAGIWKAGVRAKANKEGVFEGGELKRCLDLVMEEESREEIRKNALRWRDLAREAGAEGGSGDRNIRAFVEEMRGAENGVEGTFASSL